MFVTLLIPTLKDVHEIVTCIAPFLKPGQVLFLKGPLGSGKSTFARALIQHLSPRGPLEDVPSPTFTLMQSYPQTTPPIIHMDLYRLLEPSELEELGFQEDQPRSVTLVEWPDMIPPQTLTPTYILDFSQHENQHALTLTLEGEQTPLTQVLKKWVIHP